MAKKKAKKRRITGRTRTAVVPGYGLISLRSLGYSDAMDHYAPRKEYRKSKHYMAGHKAGVASVYRELAGPLGENPRRRKVKAKRKVKRRANCKVVRNAKRVTRKKGAGKRRSYKVPKKAKIWSYQWKRHAAGLKRGIKGAAAKHLATVQHPRKANPKRVDINIYVKSGRPKIVVAKGVTSKGRGVVNGVEAAAKVVKQKCPRFKGGILCTAWALKATKAIARQMKARTKTINVS